MERVIRISTGLYSAPFQSNTGWEFLDEGTVVILVGRRRKTNRRPYFWGDLVLIDGRLRWIPYIHLLEDANPEQEIV